LQFLKIILYFQLLYRQHQQVKFPNYTDIGTKFESWIALWSVYRGFNIFGL
jgi:hypothetical protein